MKNGLRAYVRISSDHHVVGVQYLVTGFVFFLVGGTLALLVRAELTVPGLDFIQGEAYNRLFSNHGSIMVFLSLLPAVLGLTHAVLPETLGADRPALPRVSALAFWLVPLAGMFMLASFFLGGASAGWTAYVPLSLKTPGVGQSLWSVSLMLLILSLGLSAINFLRTIRDHRRGSIHELPLFGSATLTSSFLAIVTSPILLIALAVVLFQRISGGLGSAATGASLWQNSFWFFAHPATLVMLLPTIGIVSEAIQKFSGIPIVAHRSVSRAMLAIGALGLVAWGQHMFASGLLSAARTPFMIVSIAIALPLAYIVFVWIATLWLGEVRFSTPMLFALGFISLFIVGGLSGIVLASVPINLQLHASYFVTGHLHFMFLGGVISGLYAGIYYWFPRWSGKTYDETLGVLHALGHVGGVMASYAPMFVLGILGLRRRVFDYPEDLGIFQLAVTAGALILAGTLMLFLYNMLFSLLRGERVERSQMKAGWDFQPLGEQDVV